MLEELPEELPKGKKIQLALAIAQGKSVSMWARQNEVPKSTAYRWVRDRKLRRAVDSCRRRALDQSIDRMAQHANWATDEIVTLAKVAESESVRLRALRTICSDVMAVNKFSELEFRVAELEEMLRDRLGSPDLSR